ncbi:NYN domain-containing protein [Azoarcus sp. DN11]|uniref:NYN domain-containing protein n=1 Tax=Azoarcus sp. DN11 TaxID=356837 RepID=UPI000EB59B2D|nr:NYN domain-containing protein [Azoarcus sp. DN11]AYH43697.1 hypothetical protein CDA09_09915 [Azoarcus sp. DN11]
MKYELPSFAVLIDADNVSQEFIAPILEEITRHARITVRRIYGDFTTSNLAAWKTKLAEHAIQPIQQYRYTVGKNASDSALIIDAMDLLHSRRFEGFCLVSSDSDFTRLATRIREDGLVVYGFGEKKAPKAFVNACDRYIYVENLLNTRQPDSQNGIPAPEGATSIPAAAPAIAAQAAPADDIVLPQTPVPAQATEPPPAPSFKPPALALNLLMRAYTNVADELGWALLGHVSSYIHANHSDFDPRTYGCTKFIDLIQKTAAFELVQRPYKNGHSYFCRPSNGSRPAAPAAAPKPPSPQTYRAALIQAVKDATAANGWALVSSVGQKLKGAGQRVENSGHSTLTEALKATGLFEMRGSGAARYFRLRADGKAAAG